MWNSLQRGVFKLLTFQESYMIVIGDVFLSELKEKKEIRCLGEFKEWNFLDKVLILIENKKIETFPNICNLGYITPNKKYGFHLLWGGGP